MASRNLVVNFIGDTAQLDAALKRVGTSISRLQRTATRMNAVGNSLTRGLTVPIVGVGVAAAKMASDFQSSTERLRTQAGASQAQVEKLRAGILKMAGSLGTSPKDLSAGMYHVVSSMNAVLPPSQRVSGELTVLRDAAKLAKVGGSDLEETTYALASAMNALHAPVSQAAKVTGQLNAIVGAGDMTMSDLIDSFRSGVVPSARAAGLSLQSLGAPMAVMGDMGIRGALAGTRLRMAIALLSSPSAAAAKVLGTLGLSAKQATSTSGAMAKALSAAGLRTTQLGADLKKPNGMAVALRDLNDHLRASGLTATGAAAVMTKAFGGGRMGTAITLLAQNTGRLQTKFDQINAKAKSFGADWTATTHTTAFKWQKMVATMEAAGIKFGNQVLPVILPMLQNVAGGIAKVGGAFDRLSPSMKSTIVQVLLVTAALGPVLKLSAALISTVRGLASVLKWVVWKPLVAGAQGALWIFRELRAGTLLLRVQLAALAVQERASAAWSAIKAGASAVAGVFRELRDGTMLLRGQLVLLWLQEKAGAAWSTLTGLFRSQGAAAAAESVEVNGLAASMERLTVAQRAAAVSGEAGGIAAGGLGARAAGFAAGRLIPGAAAAYLGFKGIQSFVSPTTQYAGPGGLAKLLGPTSAWTSGYSDPAGMHMSGNIGDMLAGLPLIGSHSGMVKEVANSGTQATKMLATLRSGLKGVSDTSQLTSGQLNRYYGIVQRLIAQPDGTAKQRKGWTLLGQVLNPVTNELARTTAAWADSFAGIDVTTAHAMRQVTRSVQSSVHTLETNAPRGTRRWTTQMTGLIAAAWQKIQSLSHAGVAGVGGAIARLNRIVAGELHKLGTMIPPGLLKGAESGGMAGITNLLAWASSQSSASKQGVSTQSEQGIAGRGIHYNVAGSPAGRRHAASQQVTVTPPSLPHHHRRGPAVHEYWDPFTNSFKLMTAAQHAGLRDKWIAQNGAAPPSGPSRRSGSSGSGGSTSSRAGRASGTSAAASAFQPPSQSNAMQIQFQNLANALQQAQNANNTQAQNAILHREIKLDRRAIGLDTRRLTAINRLLRGQISVTRRQKLLQDKLSILQDIGNLRGNVGSAMSQLQSATSAGAGTFDLAPAGASVTAPTIYDVRRAARGERHKLAGQHHHHHGDVHIGDIHIHDRKDVDYFADRLDRALGSGVHAKLRAAGMRGT